MERPLMGCPRMELKINSIGLSARPQYACRIILVRASSTARVTALHSCGENPNDSVNRSTAPRTAQSNMGLLGNSILISKPSLESLLRSLSLLLRSESGTFNVTLCFSFWTDEFQAGINFCKNPLATCGACHAGALSQPSLNQSDEA